MIVQIGDVYWFRVVNPRTDESEVRPIVVLSIEDDNCLIASFATITTSEIEDFDGKYDKWKSPIFGWRALGLRDASYVKANCLASTETMLFSTNDYIGKMNRFDLDSALAKIEDFLNSDEEAW
ncbi:hypothetical protein [Sporosarcina obsidiansis]|uniref:hypothetical protein n=1 Tax=Sporosarcina obsidiansis TaxID=2660748 RepID=UPI00129A8502|nr:hypothetical protein [Sporosarcina obsidiansis]